MVSLSARRILGSRQRDAWDALADIEVFIFATKAELVAMDANDLRLGEAALLHALSNLVDWAGLYFTMGNFPEAGSKRMAIGADMVSP